MPKYDITALERFCVKTRYLGVEAPDERTAERLCMTGQESYDSYEIVEGFDKWLETLDVEESETQ